MPYGSRAAAVGVRMDDSAWRVLDNVAGCKALWTGQTVRRPGHRPVTEAASTRGSSNPLPCQIPAPLLLTQPTQQQVLCRCSIPRTDHSDKITSPGTAAPPQLTQRNRRQSATRTDAATSGRRGTCPYTGHPSHWSTPSSRLHSRQFSSISARFRRLANSRLADIAYRAVLPVTKPIGCPNGSWAAPIHRAPGTSIRSC
jgi:hypothetical protein